MRIKGFELFIVIVSIIVFSGSCRTLKKTVVNGGNSTIENIYDSLKLAEIKYKTLEIKLNFNYEKVQEKLELKGLLKIQKDSLIWISLNAVLGIELMRVMVTNDSVYILDRINKTYTVSNFEYIKNKYTIDIDYNSLQSILTGVFFIYPNVGNEKEVFLQTYSIKNDSNGLDIYRKTSENVENLVQIDRSHFKINGNIINDISNLRNLTINYSLMELEKNSLFPKKIAIKSVNKNKLLGLNVDFTKVTIDNNPSYSFKIPANYEVIKP